MPTYLENKYIYVVAHTMTQNFHSQSALKLFDICNVYL